MTDRTHLAQYGPSSHDKVIPLISCSASERGKGPSALNVVGGGYKWASKEVTSGLVKTWGTGLGPEQNSG